MPSSPFMSAFNGRLLGLSPDSRTPKQDLDILKTLIASELHRTIDVTTGDITTDVETEAVLVQLLSKENLD